MDIPQSTRFGRIIWRPIVTEQAEREHELELEEITLSDHELYERHQAILADKLYEKEGDR